MINLQLDLQTGTESKLMYLLSLYSDKDIFFRNVINYQINQLKSESINFKVDLVTFEKKYNMSSASFYQLYQSGKTDDSEDSLLWSGVYEMFLENQKKIEELQ